MLALTMCPPYLAREPGFSTVVRQGEKGGSWSSLPRLGAGLEDDLVEEEMEEGEEVGRAGSRLEVIPDRLRGI